MEKDQKIYGLFSHEKPKNIYSEWDNHGNFTLILVKRNEAGQIRNFTASTFSDDDNLPFYLADLQLRCFYTVKNHEIDGLYGWKVEYKPYTVDLPTAEKMIKTLRKVNKGLEKIAAEWGRAQTFAEYAQRFLKVVGASGMVRRVGDSRPGGFSYDDSQFRASDIPDVPAVILGEEADYKDELAKKAAA